MLLNPLILEAIKDKINPVISTFISKGIDLANESTKNMKLSHNMNSSIVFDNLSVVDVKTGASMLVVVVKAEGVASLMVNHNEK